MISPDAAADLRAERRFDMIAAILIGAIAVLAAILSVMQISYNQQATRADVRAARLTADLSARISASTEASDWAYASQQNAMAFNLDGLAHSIAALQMDDAGAGAVAQAQSDASTKLASALAATAATIGNSPLDAYAAGLLTTTTPELLAQVAEQNRQVDLAERASSREQTAILGLSFLALAGVLTGLAAVLREGRPGWTALLTAIAMATSASAMAVVAFV
jgi:hypothetical protein